MRRTLVVRFLVRRTQLRHQRIAKTLDAAEGVEAIGIARYRAIN
jgi:hypothetical protein